MKDHCHSNKVEVNSNFSFSYGLYLILKVKMECVLPDYSYTPSTSFPTKSRPTLPNFISGWNTKCPTADVDLECGQYWETRVNVCLHKK